MLGSSVSALLDVDSRKFYTHKCMSVSFIEDCLYSAFKHVNVQSRITGIFKVCAKKEEYLDQLGYLTSRYICFLLSWIKYV